MAPNVLDRAVAWLLMVYLVAVGLAAAVNLVAGFDLRSTTAPAIDKGAQSGGATPPQPGDPAGNAPAQPVEKAATATVACSSWLVICHVQHDGASMLTLALLAGIVGSFLHAAQSLTSYIGNDTFKISWAPWYLMRPWIGGILALAMTLAAQAGLVGGGGGGSNVYGIAALGLLGGWFSKTTTDKLQEVFSTLFKTDADKERTDKLKGDQPVIKEISPPTVPQAATEISIKGTGFTTGAHVTIGDTTTEATFVSPAELRVDLTKLPTRPTGRVEVVVTNPSGNRPKSEAFSVTFA